MKDLKEKLLDVLNNPKTINTLEAQQEHVFEPIIRHNLRFEDARTILDFFGTLADHGRDPIKLLRNNLFDFADLSTFASVMTKTRKVTNFTPRFSSSVSSFSTYPIRNNLPFFGHSFIYGKEYYEQQLFRLLPAGTFYMGSPPDEYGRSDDETKHLVEITKPFLMMTTPVTQRFWKHIMGNNPSFFVGPERPVEFVSWHDCQEFIKMLNSMTNEGTFRLPTEAEWEYVCRAGTSTPFNTGENLTTDQANYNGNYPYNSFPKGEYEEKTTPVGAYLYNSWGFYDMHGNVWEWCQDWYSNEYYYGYKKQGITTNPTGPENGSDRVLRGGAWRDVAQYCRSADRRCDGPGNRGSFIGFRLVFVPKKIV